jgi:sulfate/thiosulfate transport system permease protein
MAAPSTRSSCRDAIAAAAESFRRAAACGRYASAGLVSSRNRILPGLPLTLGFAVTYLSLLVLIPLSAAVIKASGLGFEGFWNAVTSPRVVHAYQISLITALIAAAFNAVMGVLLAWVLVRYEFPGRRLIDALVDLPIALPTAVAGIALTALYAPKGLLGAPLAAHGIQVAFTPTGITIALAFIGLPFVVRTVQPVLEDLDIALEEAAACLGATRLQTFFRVLLPALAPAIVTGATLALARGIGEYGSVIFIAGNRPGVSEIAPLLVVTKLEQYDYNGAAAIAVTLLMLSLTLLLIGNLLQWRLAHRGARR